MARDDDPGLPRSFVWSAGILVAVLGSVQGYVINQVGGLQSSERRLEVQVARNEVLHSNRLDVIEKRIFKIPEEVPPRWMRDKVDECIRRLDRLENYHRASPKNN